MLAVTSYPVAHVDQIKSVIDKQLDAFLRITSAPEFDAEFFRNLVLALDRCFVHRMRGADGKDGKPLNEMRMICDSVVANGGILAGDKTIKYAPEASATGLSIGDEIRLDLTGFRKLAAGVFAEIGQRFPPS